MTGVELILGAMALGAVVWLVVKTKARARRVAMAAEIARIETSPVSLLGRVVVTAMVIVGVQWLVITHPANKTLLVVVLAIPVLITACVLVRALTVTEIRPSRGRDGRR